MSSTNKSKTNRSALKRFKITKKKIMHRHVKQNHFNARDTGEQTREKHGYKSLYGKNLKNIKKVLPYA